MTENKHVKKVIRPKNQTKEVEKPIAEVEKTAESKKTPVVTIKAKTPTKKKSSSDKPAVQKAPEWAYWTFIPLAFVLVLGLVIFMIAMSGSVAN